MPEGRCQLCGSESILQLSHILPAFVFRWMRETSGNGHLRFGEAPNLRVQDGLKRHWLCASCESLFARSETAFADQLFHPYSRIVSIHLWRMAFTLLCISDLAGLASLPRGDYFQRL